MRWTGRLLTVGLLTLVGVELLLRALQPPSLQYYRQLKLLHRFDERYLVGLEPNVDLYLKHNAGLWEGRFRTNSLGYRGSAEPDPALPKIVCQGDSLVMGFGVSDEQTFCRLLDGLQLRGKTYQAQNLGVDAFGSAGNAARLQEASERLKNIEIALLFVSPNDFTLPQELRDRGIRSDDENQIEREKNPGLARAFQIQFALTHYLFTLHAASIALEQTRINLQLTFSRMTAVLRDIGLLKSEAPRRGLGRYLIDSFYPPRPSQATPPAASPARAAAPLCPAPAPERFRPCSETAPSAASLEPLPELTQRYYRQMISAAKRDGYALYFVFLPVQLEEMYCIQHGKHSEFSNFVIRARSFVEKEGGRVLDLRPYAGKLCGEPIYGPDGALLRYSIPDDYIIPGDGHLTELGNRWAAAAVRAELERAAANNAL